MPRINEITVNAGRTFNHPYESYSNLRPSVTVRAELLDGEDWQSVTKDLQAKAESLVEDHKQNMLRTLEELHDLTIRQREVAGLEHSIRDAQERLDRLREGLPAIEPPKQQSFIEDDDGDKSDDDDDRQGARNYGRY